MECRKIKTEKFRQTKYKHSLPAEKIQYFLDKHYILSDNTILHQTNIISRKTNIISCQTYISISRQTNNISRQTNIISRQTYTSISRQTNIISRQTKIIFRQTNIISHQDKHYFLPGQTLYPVRQTLYHTSLYNTSFLMYNLTNTMFS